MKRNKIGTVGLTEKDKQSKGLVPVRPSLFYYRGTLGEPLTPLFPKFDLWDPNMHLMDWTYSSLHDPHLKRFFSQPNKKRLLIKLGLITHDEKLLCSRKEFSRYMNYIKTVQQSWEKLFVQKQKQLLKKFILLQLRGQVPEHVTVSDMKEWLIYKGRNTFRSMYRKFMKWSDPHCAELAWELSQRFQLEDLEKEVVRELQLKGQGLHNLEVLSRSSGACPGSPVETEEVSSVVLAQMTVESLHNYIRRITTSLTGEIKENLVPVLLEQLHDGCTKPRNSADSSSDFLPKYSSSEDMAQTEAENTSTAVSCRKTSEESCSSLFNSVNLSGIFSGYSTTASTDVVTCKGHSSDSLQKSPSTVTDPAKFKSLAKDVCGLDTMAVIPYYGGSVSLLSPAIKTDLAEDMESSNLSSPTLSSLSSLTPVTRQVSSFEIISDLADDIESPASRDSRNQSPLLAKAEIVVLEVLNHSVALLKSLLIVQKENGWYKDPDLQMSETDIQSADTPSKIEEILSNLPSLSSSSLSSLTLATSLSSFEMKSDLADDIESPASRDSRNQSPLLAKAEIVVLEVLNHSVALLKSLLIVQKENGWYKDPDLQMSETDIQSADTPSKIEEILSNLPSLSSSSLSSLTLATSLSSFEMKSDLADDIESPASRDSRNQSPLLAKAETVVLEVLNHSVALLKSFLIMQKENGWYKDPDLEMTETDIQSADTLSKIEEIRPSLSSLSSLSSISSLTESGKSSSIIGHLSSSHINIISGDGVEPSLERVIPVLQIEGLLGPLHTSEEMNESSSFISSDSDPTSQSACCVSVGPTQSKLTGGHNGKEPIPSPETERLLVSCTTEIIESVVKSVLMAWSQRCSPSPSSHQLSSEASRALSETLVRIQRKLSSEPLKETASHENSNAIVELLNDMVRQIQASPSLHSQHQDSPISLQRPSIMSSCPTLKDTKVQTAFEGLESMLLAQNVQPVIGIIHETNKEQLPCPVSEDTRTAFTDLAEDIICSAPLSIAELRSDGPLAANYEFAGPSDLRNTLRKILLSSCDSTCTQSDQINEEESSRNLASSLAHVVYQHLQDEHQPEIQISKTLDEYTTTKVDCSDKACSLEVKVISSPPSESVINLLERTFDNKAKTSNVVKSAFKQLANNFLKMLHIQSQSDATKLTVHKFMVEELSEGTLENSHCTIDTSDSPSSTKPVLKHYSDIVLRVVERIVTKIIMETFRLHRLSPESASHNQDFESFISSHPQHEFILWLRSSIVETILGQLFIPQKVTDVRDATRAENPAGTLAATEEIVTEMPVIENIPVGSKPKRMKQVQAFFRWAWQAVKKTCRCGRRSNKISPYN